MYNVLTNMKDTVAKYSLDYLNCFERPVAIAMNFIEHNSGNLYIAYRKFYQAFSIQEEKGNLLFTSYEEDTGIQSHCVTITNNLTETLISLLDQNFPVVVPGDLISLYYSSHYMQDHWSHLFLIKGYDREKRLFYILDSIQQHTTDEIPVSYDFPIRFDDLEAVFQEYGKTKEPVICYYEKTDSSISFRDRLIKCFQLFYNHIKAENYIEKRLRVAFEEDSDKRVYIDLLMNCPKYRIAGLESLLTSMKDLSYDTSAFQPILNEISKEWTLVNRIFSMKLLKNKNSTTEYPISNALKDAEQRLLNELEKVLLFLEKQYETKETSYLFENNQDQIIIPKDNSFLFQFHNDKLYNSWCSDYCPKVIVHSSKSPITAFEFSITTEVKLDRNVEGHQEGIFLRTSKQDMYTFGIDYLKTLAFDYVGKIFIDTYKCPVSTSAVTLFTNLKDEMLTFGVRNENQMLIPVATVPFDFEVVQIGFYSKTWNQCFELETEIYDVKLKLE